MEAHLEVVKKDPVEEALLLVITPDEHEPSVVEALKSDPIYWLNFAMLTDAIDVLLQPGEPFDHAVLTEREQFLLRELVNLLENDGLTETAGDRVLVVPARTAIDDYERYHVYICQPNRSFRPSNHIGFYYDNQIDPRFPRILDQIENDKVSESGRRVAWTQNQRYVPLDALKDGPKRTSELEESSI